MLGALVLGACPKPSASPETAARGQAPALCARPADRGPAPPPADPGFAGCTRVTEGPTCWLRDDGVVTVWVPDGYALPDIVEGAAEWSERAMPGGVAVDLAPEVDRIRLAGPIDLVAHRMAPDDPYEIATGSDVDCLDADSLAELPDRVAVFARAHCASMRARGRAGPATPRADATHELIEATAAMDAIGELGLAEFYEQINAHLAVRARALAEARALLSAAGPRIPEDLGAAAKREWLLAELAVAALDRREAAARRRSLATLLRVTGDLGRAEKTEYDAALTDALHTGDYLALAQALAPRVDLQKPECDHGALNLTWTLLLAARAAGGVTWYDGPVPPLPSMDYLWWSERTAEGLDDDDACEHETADARGNARINLGLAYLLEDRVEEAAAAIGGQRPDRAEFVLVFLDVWGEILRARGDWDGAEAAYTEAMQLAGADLEAFWRARDGLARVYEDRGEDDVALRLYAEAEQAFGEASILVPLSAGREWFFSQRQEAVARQVDLLLRNDRPEQALVALRQARAAYLTSLVASTSAAQLDPEARSRLDALIQHRREGETNTVEDVDAALAAIAPSVSRVRRGAQPGELLLAWAELADGRWVGFASTDQGVDVVDPIDRPSPRRSTPRNGSGCYRPAACSVPSTSTRCPSTARRCWTRSPRRTCSTWPHPPPNRPSTASWSSPTPSPHRTNYRSPTTRPFAPRPPSSPAQRRSSPDRACAPPTCWTSFLGPMSSMPPYTPAAATTSPPVSSRWPAVRRSAALTSSRYHGSRPSSSSRAANRPVRATPKWTAWRSARPSWCGARSS